MKRSISTVCVLGAVSVLSVVLCLPPTATAAPIQPPQPGIVLTLIGGTFEAPRMSGYEFRVNDDIAVTHLGVYDHGANGLAVSHEVGLWTLNGQLLASATVQAGTVETLTSSFRFQAIPLVHLSEGVEYVVASTTPIGDPIAFSSTYVNPEEVTWIRARTREGDSFHFAGGTNVNRGYFGGNFMFVPEPCTIVLMASGMVALVRRRAKRRS